MSSHFTFTVEVDVEHDSGMFAARDEIAEQIIGALEGADYGSWSGIGANGDSEYSTSDWSVTEEPQPPRRRRR